MDGFSKRDKCLKLRVMFHFLRFYPYLQGLCNVNGNIRCDKSNPMSLRSEVFILILKFLCPHLLSFFFFDIFIDNQYREQMLQTISEAELTVAKLINEKSALAIQLEDEKRKCEDLLFRFEEESVNKDDIQVYIPIRIIYIPVQEYK